MVGSAATAAAASAVQLHFSVEPEETLPYIPVTFRVRAINTGSAPALLPIGVRLEARIGSEDWNPICFVDTETNGCALTFPVEEGPRIELAPGEERVLDFLAGPESPLWFRHRDLLEPGTYRLRLVTWGEFEGWEAVTSNEAVLTIRTPTGEDAGAWKLIGGAPSNIGLFADQLWTLYPNSVYTATTPRGAPARGDWKAYLDAYTEVLTLNPPPGFADFFKHQIGLAHTYLLDEVARKFDVQRAFQHAQAARAIFEELVGKETEFEVKAEAAKMLEGNGLTLAAIEAYVERARYYKPAPECERAGVKAVRDALVELMASDGASDTAKKALTAILADLDQFEIEAAKTPPDMHAALASLEQAASRIETAVKSEWISSTDGTSALKALASAARSSATKAIDAASNATGAKRSDLDLAKRKAEEARGFVEAGDFKKAISRFREALHKAEGSSPARGSFC